MDKIDYVVKLGHASGTIKALLDWSERLTKEEIIDTLKKLNDELEKEEEKH